MRSWRDYCVVELVERLATAAFQLVELDRCAVDQPANLPLVAGFVRCLGNKLSPRGRRNDMPPPTPTAVRLAAGGSASVRGRVRSPHVAKLQAASVPVP